MVSKIWFSLSPWTLTDEKNSRELKSCHGSVKERLYCHHPSIAGAREDGKRGSRWLIGSGIIQDPACFLSASSDWGNSCEAETPFPRLLPCFHASIPPWQMLTLYRNKNNKVLSRGEHDCHRDMYDTCECYENLGKVWSSRRTIVRPLKSLWGGLMGAEDRLALP